MPANPIVWLGDGLDPELAGGKAATLGRLIAAGLPVPPGFVVTEAAIVAPELIEAAAKVGPGPFAVRSSSAAEDLPDASYAGLYETLLNVEADGLATAVAECFASATSQRVRIYQERHAAAHGPAMAVLVQQMVDADAAGVAFTANPVTGDLDETVVTATRGLGERLVSGETSGEEWTIRGQEATRTRETDVGVLRPEQARAIAELARHVERALGSPQDIEWAIARDRPYLLQARPMTALPDQVIWEPPGPGLWMRNFRLGEWLPEAMTPLFATWLLPRIEDGFLDGVRATVGTAVPFRYASVHGWYYNAPPIPSPRLLARVLAEGRGRAAWVLFNALVRVGRNLAAADRAALAGLYQIWRDTELPAYRRLIDDGAQAAEPANPQELIALVDRLADARGGSCGSCPSWADRHGRWKPAWRGSAAATCPMCSTPTAASFVVAEAGLVLASPAPA